MPLAVIGGGLAVDGRPDESIELSVAAKRREGTDFGFFAKSNCDSFRSAGERCGGQEA